MTDMSSLNTRFDNLRTHLSQQCSDIDLSSHFGKKRFIVFISVCDGDERASVFKAIADSIDGAWTTAANRAKKHMTTRGMEGKWLKADVVNTIFPHDKGSFDTIVKRRRINYLRKGIAFDPYFEDAFLEQEVHGNAMIVQDNGTKHRHFNFNNINHYRKKYQGKKEKLVEKNIALIFEFHTKGAIDVDGQIYDLVDAGLDINRREVDLDGDLVFKLIEDSSSFLADQVDDLGKFRYGYFSCFDKEINTYNMLRHASTTYAMVEAYELTQDKNLGAAIKRRLSFLSNEGVKTISHEGISKGFVVELVGDREIKLGANATALLAYAKYTEVFGSDQYMELMGQLAAGIEFMQNSYNGSFVHVLNYPDLDVKEITRIIYYDGEAAFSLLRYYAIAREERWLDVVKKAFEWFINKGYHKHRDHWLSYCSYELFKHVPEEKYYRFNLMNAGAILDFALVRETTYPTLLELMMATKNLLQFNEEKGHGYDEPEAFDPDKLERAIDYRANYLLNGFMFEEVAMYFKKPGHVLGGFFIRHHSIRVRIDDIEHNLSGFCRYWLTYCDNK